jgi:class 3 adenylate cyclase
LAVQASQWGGNVHRIFRKALDTATGESQFVIAVIIDIRGFSTFSQTRESPDTAMFIKRVYMKLIDSYFNFASFYKSTGDGLLFAIPFNEGTLKEMAQKTVASCIACHTEFGNICNKDPMINFEVPDKIGIGIARGTACCLISGEYIIDYSGRLLNLTARLTNLARPSGIIIDGGFGIELLDKNIRDKFKKQDVYLDGMYEYEPIQVYFSKQSAKIPDRNTEPIATKTWRHLSDTLSFGDLLKLREFEYLLPSEATSAEETKVTARHDKVIKGRVSKKYYTIVDCEDVTRYKVVADKPKLFIDYPKLCRMLKNKSHVKNKMDVVIDIAYVEK